jgi:biotin operon repressor
MPGYNPFRPGLLASPEVFAGRAQELNFLERALQQTRRGNPRHILLNGERGIGKSSLLHQFRRVAQGAVVPSDGVPLSFIVASTRLQTSHTFTDITKRVAREVANQLEQTHRFKEAAKSTLEFLRRFELMGVKYTHETKAALSDELIEDLVRALQGAANTVEGIDGVLLVIDEADKPEPAANLGSLVRMLTEGLTMCGCDKVAVCLVGLPGVLDTLRHSDPSSLRVFQVMTLHPLLLPERSEAIRLGLDEAERENGFRTLITDEAVDTLSDLSDGYPHFLQQFAYSAYEADSDSAIDVDDVLEGAFGPRGAFAQLGAAYFSGLYFDDVASENYRSILDFIARSTDEWVTREDLRKALSLKTSTIDGGIAALKKRGLLVTNPRARGAYRLMTKSFGAWIRAYSEAEAVAVIGKGS